MYELLVSRIQNGVADNQAFQVQDQSYRYGSGHEGVLSCYLVLLSFDSKTR